MTFPNRYAELATSRFVVSSELENAIFWIKAHRRVLDAAEESPRYLAYAQKRLNEHLAKYLVEVEAMTEIMEEYKCL